MADILNKFILWLYISESLRTQLKITAKQYLAQFTHLFGFSNHLISNSIWRESLK